MRNKLGPHYNIAIDNSGNTVFINDAIKGVDYYCPECGVKFVLKKSGNTGPGSRIAHFAHPGHGYNCTPESILHKAFKIETAKLLEQYLAEKKTFLIKWSCSHCPAKYNGNLLFSASSIVVEKDLGVCQPDIAILDKDGNVRIVIEVVVTHEPEQPVLDYYKENGIIMVRLDVIEEDLQNIAAKLSCPNQVTLCLHTRCGEFSLKNHTRNFVPINRKCQKCGKEIKTLGLKRETAIGIFGKVFDPTPKEEAGIYQNHYGKKGIHMRVLKIYGRKVTVPSTTCDCTGNHIKKAKPSQYYFDDKTWTYKKIRRL